MFNQIVTAIIYLCLLVILDIYMVKVSKWKKQKLILYIIFSNILLLIFLIPLLNTVSSTLKLQTSNYEISFHFPHKYRKNENFYSSELTNKSDLYVIADNYVDKDDYFNTYEKAAQNKDYDLFNKEENASYYTYFFKKGKDIYRIARLFFVDDQVFEIGIIDRDDMSKPNYDRKYYSIYLSPKIKGINE